MRTSPRTAAVSLFVLAVSAAALWVYSRTKSPARPNVLVLLLDTTRADHLGVLGYERDTSSNIDRFARENLLFRHAFTAAPWTPPSVATLFSGLYASSHGMMPPDRTPTGGDTLRRLDERVLTLAEILKISGYQTAAISSNPWITPEFGYGQGFESFTVKLEAPADEITEAGLAKVGELQAGQAPFLLYVHYLDPHAPYKPPKDHDIYSGALENARYIAPIQKELNRYDGEIHYLDASLGRLFAGLAAKGVYDDLVIVLLGDHGEQFGEHGNKGHGWQLFNEELRVPLILKPGRGETGRGASGRSIDSVVSIIDVLPTLLVLADVTRPVGLPGVSLLDERALAARPGVFAEIDRRLSLRGYVGANGRKLVLGSLDEKVKFDPAEPLRDIVGLFDWRTPEKAPIEDAPLLREMENEFVEVLGRVNRAKITPTSRGVVPSAETLEHLNGLGYVK